MQSKPFGLVLCAENDQQLQEGTWTCAHIEKNLIVDRVKDQWEFISDGEKLTVEQMKNKLWLNFTSVVLSQYLKNNAK